MSSSFEEADQDLELFQKRLEADLVQSWSTHYVDIPLLRKILADVLGKPLKKGQAKYETIIDLEEEEPDMMSPSFVVPFPRTRRRSSAELLKKMDTATHDDKKEDDGGRLSPPPSTDVKQLISGFPREMYGTFPAAYRPLLDALSEEVTSADAFYTSHVEVLRRKADLLRGKINEVEHRVGLQSDNHEASNRDLTLASLQRTSITLYREMRYLDNFAHVNSGACKAVLNALRLAGGGIEKRKFGEENSVSLITEAAEKHFIKNSAIFNDDDPTGSLKEEMERHVQTYARFFCHGDEMLAKQRLLVKTHEHSLDWNLVLIGAQVGMLCLLVCWILFDIYFSKNDIDIHKVDEGVIRIFRFVGCCLLFFCLWGVSVHIWNLGRVNYIYILGLDPHAQSSPDEFLLRATRYSFVYLLFALFYLKSIKEELSLPFAVHWLPLLLYMVCIFLLLRAVSRTIFVKNGDTYEIDLSNSILLTIAQIFVSPFSKVTFFHSYLADVMSSLVKVFQDFIYATCFIAHSGAVLGKTNTSCGDTWIVQRVMFPVVAVLPVFFRLMQSFRRYYETRIIFPELFNAIKYAISHCVVVIGLCHPYFKEAVGIHHSVTFYQVLYILFVATSTMYGWLWDIYVDWGLGQKEYDGLRKRRMYPFTKMYYVAIILDFFLRYCWVLTLVPTSGKAKEWSFVQRSAYDLGPYLPMFEVIQRMSWGLFRLENAHVKNVFLYSELDFIPLHFETPTRKAHERRKTIAQKKKKTVHAKRKERETGESIAYLIGVALVVIAVVCIALLTEQKDSEL
eukprot:g1792.t1